MYLPKDKVNILPINKEGVVVNCLLSLNGNEYFVRYYLDEKQEHSYFFEEELKAK